MNAHNFVSNQNMCRPKPARKPNAKHIKRTRKTFFLFYGIANFLTGERTPQYIS